MDNDAQSKPRYKLRPITTPVEGADAGTNGPSGRKVKDPFLRPAAEDDDGYDPFSDRPPAPEPAFQEDPWR